MKRHVQTIFCDDVRHEVGNKISIIGVYSGGLFVPSFPVTLPKLCLVVKIVTPAEETLKSAVIRVLKDDETLHEVMVDEEQLASTPIPAELSPNIKVPNRAQSVQYILVFSPIHFERPCALRVRVQTESGELKGMGLLIDQSPIPPSADVVSH